MAMQITLFNGAEVASTMNNAVNAFCEVVTSLGIEARIGDNNGYIYTLVIKFPSMQSEGNAVLYADNILSTQLIILSDAENGFLEAVVDYTDLDEYWPGNYAHSLYKCFCWISGGEVVSAIKNADYEQYKIFNIPLWIGDATKQELQLQYELYPLFYYLTGIVKNVYVAWPKLFSPGLRVLDQDGKQWVTLGGYYLYRE